MPVRFGFGKMNYRTNTEPVVLGSLWVLPYETSLYKFLLPYVKVPAVNIGGRMYSYENFVVEVEELINSGKPMLNSRSLTNESSCFRKWKHQLEDTLKRIQAEDYNVNVQLKSRYFRPMYPCSEQERWTHFNDELDLTLFELQTTLDNYRRHGPPRRKNERATGQPDVTQSSISSVATPPAPTEVSHGPVPVVLSEPAQPLALPEKVTWPWLVKHVPVTMWGAAIAFAASIFSTGVYIGKFWKG